MWRFPVQKWPTWTINQQLWTANGMNGENGLCAMPLVVVVYQHDREKSQFQQNMVAVHALENSALRQRLAIFCPAKVPKSSLLGVALGSQVTSVVGRLLNGLGMCSMEKNVKKSLVQAVVTLKSSTLIRHTKSVAGNACRTCHFPGETSQPPNLLWKTTNLDAISNQLTALVVFIFLTGLGTGKTQRPEGAKKRTALTAVTQNSWMLSRRTKNALRPVMANYLSIE